MSQIIIVEPSIYCVLIPVENYAKAVSLPVRCVMAFIDCSVFVDAADETFWLEEFIVLADEGVVCT